MASIVYRLQPWAFVDRLVLDLCPPGFELLPMARDASAVERAELLRNAEFLMGSWVTTNVTLSEQDYAAAPHLKLVQLMSAGYEHVDVKLATRFGVPVATFGDAMASVVAEHTLLLMLAVYRRLLQLDRALRRLAHQ
jgi:lactate dehydrogenase-like 2-hydroxyacid dehydrogenase